MIVRASKNRFGGLVTILRLAEAVPCIFSPLLYRLSYLGVRVGSAYKIVERASSQA